MMKGDVKTMYTVGVGGLFANYLAEFGTFLNIWLMVLKSMKMLEDL